MKLQTRVKVHILNVWQVERLLMDAVMPDVFGSHFSTGADTQQTCAHSPGKGLQEDNRVSRVVAGVELRCLWVLDSSSSCATMGKSACLCFRI